MKFFWSPVLFQDDLKYTYFFKQILWLIEQIHNILTEKMEQMSQFDLETSAFAALRRNKNNQEPKLYSDAKFQLSTIYESKNEEKGSKSYKLIMEELRQKKQASENHIQARIQKDQVIESAKVRKCGRFQLTKKRIIVIVLCTILLISAIVIPIAVVFGGKEQIKDNDSAEPYQIKHKGGKITVLSSVQSSQKGPGYTVVTACGNKTTAMQPSTEITSRCQQKENKKDAECYLIIPVLTLLSINGQDGLKTNYDWLAEFNRNPRTFVQKFMDQIRKILQAKNPAEKHELTILEINQKMLIDIKYNSKNENFELALLDSDPNQQTKETVIKPEDYEVKSDSWVESLLEKTSQKLKGIALMSLDVIKKSSMEIAKQQQKFTKDEQITGEWQDALVNECRTVNEGLFRCSQSAAQKLIPNFEAGKIPINAVLTYAFTLTIHDHCNLII